MLGIDNAVARGGDVQQNQHTSRYVTCRLSYSAASGHEGRRYIAIQAQGV